MAIDIKLVGNRFVTVFPPGVAEIGLWGGLSDMRAQRRFDLCREVERRWWENFLDQITEGN